MCRSYVDSFIFFPGTQHQCSRWELVSFLQCGKSCSSPLYLVKYQVLMAANMNNTIFWGIAPYSLVEADRRFRGTYCLPHQGGDGDSTYLWNVALLQRIYTALYPRRLYSSFLSYLRLVYLWTPAVNDLNCNFMNFGRLSDSWSLSTYTTLLSLY
jgi:hypothetical protein